MLVAVVLLGLAVLGGATVITLRSRGGNPPLLLAFGHGAIAAAGLVALVVAVVGGAGGTAVVALVVLAAAALGGFYVASFHLRGLLIPLGTALVHGVLALAGYGILLVHYLSS